MCLYPKLILNKKYVANEKNGGVVPPLLDSRAKYVPVGCQKCYECRKQKARNWAVRLTEELRENRNAIFVTLTFSDESLDELSLKIAQKDGVFPEGYEGDNLIAKTAVRYFLERWRKKTKKSVKHWLVPELGANKWYTERLHLHGILWTKDIELLGDKWKYGYIYVGDYCNERSINYAVKYFHKSDKRHPGFTPKILCSPGIGRAFLDKQDSERNIYAGENTKDNYRTQGGSKLALPTYYRNHLYNDEQREKLWLWRLDKKERWVMGERIDVSENYDDYYGALRRARKIH